MFEFEHVMKRLLSRSQTYSMTEFFYERHEIAQTVKNLENSLRDLSFYTPSYNVNYTSEGKDACYQKIKEDISLKLDEAMILCDSSFAINNYKYITVDLGNQKLAEIYELLGPFDYSTYNPDDDQADLLDEDREEEERRVWQEHFQQRRSGAQYRGELETEFYRPDGKGFKVFEGKSVYEGYF